MHRLRVVTIGPLLGIVLWTASVGMSAASAAPKPAPTSGPISNSMCTDIMSSLKEWAKTSASDSYLSSSRKADLAKTPLTGCTWRITTGTGKVPNNGLPMSSHSGNVLNAQASAPFCVGYYRQYGIFDPWGWAVMVGVTNTGWCSNGYNAMSTYFGPQCWNSTYPIYGTNVTWCGVWGGGCTPQTGMNWDWWDWKWPWWVRSGSYMRTQYYCYSPGGSLTWGYAYDF